MLKVILSICFLVNFTYKEDNFRVDKIQYDYKESAEEYITLKIELFSKQEDIIEMRVYFCDEEKKYLNKSFYSSTLKIEGHAKTIAKIPYTAEEKQYFYISFFINNGRDKDFDIYFPIYPYEKGACNLSLKTYCQSRYPTSVLYSDAIIKEEKSEVFLINSKDNFYSFNNTIPINKIKISSNYFNNDGYANLYVLDKIDEFKLYYDEGYVIPLKMDFSNPVLKFSFDANYYLDLINGIVYDEYVSGTVYKNNVIFPYYDNSYSLYIELIDCFPYFSEVQIYFSVLVEGNLIGDCYQSKYCLRRKY